MTEDQKISELLDQAYTRLDKLDLNSLPLKISFILDDLLVKAQIAKENKEIRYGIMLITQMDGILLAYDALSN